MKLDLPDPSALKPRSQDLCERTADLASSADVLRGALEQLEATFGEAFSIINAQTGEIAFSSSTAMAVDLTGRLALLDEIARRRNSEIVELESPLALLAAPLGSVARSAHFVAIGMFTTERIADECEIASAARVFGIDSRCAFDWAIVRECWSTEILTRLADTVIENILQRTELRRLRAEATAADLNARDTFAELDLLHRLAQHLNISKDESVLWSDSLKQLYGTIPASCIAAVECPDGDDALRFANDPSGVIWHGECPTSKRQLSQFVHDLGPHISKRPLVLNRRETALPTWPCPFIREIVCVPVEEGNKVRGWLLALNHRGTSEGELSEFGSVELRILTSVATMLGILGRNSHLYRRQADLFADSVRALTSAIDAKDCYTSGHSDRVARISILLAQQLGMPQEAIDTIYLGGMLHDIGKIGVDDNVLNKPGRLTDEEFDQIKQHPQYGYDILSEVRELETVLPIVLHHHESWDGTGYPHGLTGPDTPLMARIVAVADAFDAMTSDRPYRPGMPLKKVESILREGAGRQWDPGVIAAMFAAKDQIYKIINAPPVMKGPSKPVVQALA